MAATDQAFAAWLTQAAVSEARLTAEQRGVLRAAFAFRQQCGGDYYSTRLLSHFLLNADCGLKVAVIARLVGIDRTTASRQQGVSSKQAIQAAQHRLAGRPHGKLLPRFAGPILEYMVTHPDATRYDVLEFIERTWNVQVSTVALFHFCKKFGLDAATRAAPATAAGTSATTSTPIPAPTSAPTPTAPATNAAADASASKPTPTAVGPARLTLAAEPILPIQIVPGQPVPEPAPPFSTRTRNTRGRSC